MITRRSLLLGVLQEENVVTLFEERFNDWIAIVNWRLDNPNHALNRFYEEVKAFQRVADAWKQVLKRAKRVYSLAEGDCN